MIRTKFIALAVAAATALGLSACSGGSGSPAASTGASGAATAPELKLGYFANITHAPAIVGIQDGTDATFWTDDGGTTTFTAAGSGPIRPSR